MIPNHITVRQLTAILHQLFNEAFKPLENITEELSHPEQGIRQWLRYCGKLKPVIFEFRDRLQQVNFQAFTLDPAFQPITCNSLAIVINFTTDNQSNDLGLVTLLADMHNPSKQLERKKHPQRPQHKVPSILASSQLALLGGSALQKHLLIEAQLIEEQVFYQAKVLPELVYEKPDTVRAHGLFEPLAVHLVRVITSGIGLDYHPPHLQALLRGHSRCDYLQQLLVCHVSQPEIPTLPFFSDDQLCTLKWRHLAGYRELRK